MVMRSAPGEVRIVDNHRDRLRLERLDEMVMRGIELERKLPERNRQGLLREYERLSVEQDGKLAAQAASSAAAEEHSGIEKHLETSNEKAPATSTAADLNGVRAAILGANDGIISVATALIAVIGVFGPREVALTAGAVLFAGALSMAAGEFVSVSAQMHREADDGKGLGRGAALQAAIASFFAFLAGGLLPVLAAVFTGHALWIVGISLGLLLVTGLISSNPKARWKSTAILTAVGVFAFGVSYAGNLVLQALGV